MNKDDNKERAKKEAASEAAGRGRTEPKPIPISAIEQNTTPLPQKTEPLNQNRPKKTLLDVIPLGPDASAAPSDDIRIPKFNLDMHTLAKHRKPVAEKRTPPTQQPQTQMHKVQILRPTPPAEPKADNVIAQIVARDIRKLCQS